MCANTTRCCTLLHTNTTAHPATSQWDCSGILLTAQTLHIRRVLRALSSPPSLFSFCSSALFFFLWDAALVLVLEVGLIAIRPHAPSERHPLTELPLSDVPVGLISAAIRAAGGRWWEVFVCVVGRESGKNSQSIESSSV